MNPLFLQITNAAIREGPYRSNPVVTVPGHERLALLEGITNPTVLFGKSCDLVQTVHTFSASAVKPINVFDARQALAHTIVAAVRASCGLGLVQFLEKDIQDILNQ